jgi:hypothetical protein
METDMSFRMPLILLAGALVSSTATAADPPADLPAGPPGVTGRVSPDGPPALSDIEADVLHLLDDIRALKTGLVNRPVRPALPADVWPLTLGRPTALAIVQNAAAGRGSVLLSADEPAYYGGGIVARPADFLNTTITINWRMIEAELLAAGEDSPPAAQAQPAVTPEQIEELERAAAALLERLRQLRRALQLQAHSEARALTPDEAVKAWLQNPQEPVTVEFGIGEAGWPDAPIPIDEDPLPPIIADWDNRLSNGGTFSLHLTAVAIRGFQESQTDPPHDRPAGSMDTGDVDQLCKRLTGKGVRVTGLLRPSRPDDRYSDYSIIVDDAANFRIFE